MQFMPPGTGGPSSAPASGFSVAWLRAAATVALGLVFWLDLAMPPGIAVPALYVGAMVLFLWGGRPWDPIVGATAATVLTLWEYGLVVTGGRGVGWANRILVLITLWFTAALVAHYRLTVERSAARMRLQRQTLDESMARLEEIRYALDQAAIVAATDQRGVITYANDKFCEISKYSRDELLGQDHRLINSGYHSKEFIRDLWRTIANGQVWRGELRNRAKDGTIYWVDTTIVPFLDARGKPRQYLAIRSDITRRKEAEEQLAAQAALTQLGQLATVVAHEVRNPLAGLRGSLEVLRSRLTAGQKEREIIPAMIERIDTLNAKVDDILRFARPRAPVIRPVEIAPIIADAIASAQASAGSSCPTIAFAPQPLAVRADPEMLRAALLNLLLNACQAGGDVEVAVTTEGSVCQIAVRDSGDGIPPEVMDKVFEAFYTTKKSGTGLGLPIVKRLIELQHGTVRLRRREGGGTAAEVSVPLAGAGPAPPQAS